MSDHVRPTLVLVRHSVRAIFNSYNLLWSVYVYRLLHALVAFMFISQNGGDIECLVCCNLLPFTMVSKLALFLTKSTLKTIFLAQLQMA